MDFFMPSRNIRILSRKDVNLTRWEWLEIQRAILWTKRTQGEPISTIRKPLPCPSTQRNLISLFVDTIRLSAGFLIASADSLILSADILIVFLSSSKGVILLIRPKMLHRLVSTRRRRMKTYGLAPLKCMKHVAINGRHSSSRTTNEKNHYLCCVQHTI